MDHFAGLDVSVEETSVCIVDDTGASVAPPSGASDAFMTPYHVTRGELFIQERFANDPHIDAQVVSSYIEMTRFPVPRDPSYQATDSIGGLVRAADLIGQMADPYYRQKLSRLYAEFVETGEAARLGITGPGDLHDSFPEFFYAQVQPYIGDAVDYLKRTEDGPRWIANLYRRLHVKRAGKDLNPKKRAPELVVDNVAGKKRKSG